MNRKSIYVLSLSTMVGALAAGIVGGTLWGLFGFAPYHDPLALITVLAVVAGAGVFGAIMTYE